MTTLEIRNRLLADINTEALSIKSESENEVLSEMLAKLKCISRKKNSKSWIDDLGDGWIDDRTTDQIIADIKKSRTSNKDIDL